MVEGCRKRIKATVIDFLGPLDPSFPFHPKSISIGCIAFWWIIEIRGEIGDHAAHHMQFRLPFSPKPSPRTIVKWVSAAVVRECDGRGFENGLINELRFIMPNQRITLNELREFSGLTEKQPAYDYSLPWE